MQILTVDIGTGTQDILLFDSERGPENCLKLVMPSPTLLIRGRIQRGDGRAPAAADHRRDHGRWAVLVGCGRSSPRRAARPGDCRRRPHLQRRPGPGRTRAGGRDHRRGNGAQAGTGRRLCAHRVSGLRLRRDQCGVRRVRRGRCDRMPWRWPSSTTAQRRRTSAIGSSAWIIWPAGCAPTGA